MVKSAVDTLVCAGIGYVERYVHGYGLTEALACKHAAEARHLLQVAVGGRGDEHHKFLRRQLTASRGFGQHTQHITLCKCVKLGCGLVPVPLTHYIAETMSELRF